MMQGFEIGIEYFFERFPAGLPSTAKRRREGGQGVINVDTVVAENRKSELIYR
jgi:hypothetical protein